MKQIDMDKVEDQCFEEAVKAHSTSDKDGGKQMNSYAEPILDPNVSMRCGKSSCEFYNKHNKISGCHKFDDRRNCSLSMKQRRKAKNKSKRCYSINWYGY